MLNNCKDKGRKGLHFLQQEGKIIWNMNVQQNKGEIVIYQMEDGQTSLEVNLVEDTVWLSLNHMVALFDRDKSVISRHIKNIFREGELEKPEAYERPVFVS